MSWLCTRYSIFQESLKLLVMILFFPSFVTYITHGYYFRVDDKKLISYTYCLNYIYLQTCLWYITLSLDYQVKKASCESRPRFYELAWNLIIYIVSYDLKKNMAMLLGFVCNDIEKDSLFYKINFCHVL